MVTVILCDVFFHCLFVFYSGSFSPTHSGSRNLELSDLESQCAAQLRAVSEVAQVSDTETRKLPLETPSQLAFLAGKTYFLGKQKEPNCSAPKNYAQ